MARLIRIGTYNLGIRDVALYGERGVSGGHFSMGDSRITIGLNQTTWPRVVAAAVHEAVEFACTQLNVRYAPTPDYAADFATYLFSMTHSQFGEACARAGWFLAKALPDLKRAYKKARGGN